MNLITYLLLKSKIEFGLSIKFILPLIGRKKNVESPDVGKLRDSNEVLF